MPRLDESTWERVRAEWETNDRLTDGELAQKYGVTKQAVQKRREKEGWARDPSALIQRATAARLAGVPLGRPRPEEEGGGADGPGGEGAARAPAPPAAAPRARADAIAEEAERRARLIERHRTEWLMVDVALKEAFDQRNGTADARGSRTPGSFEPFKRAKIIAETLSIKQAAQRRAWGIDDPAKLRLDLPDATQDMGNVRDRLLSRLLALRERGGDPGAGGGPHG